jgi:hypothetical protein
MEQMLALPNHKPLASFSPQNFLKLPPRIPAHHGQALLSGVGNDQQVNNYNDQYYKKPNRKHSVRIYIRTISNTVPIIYCTTQT